MAPGSYSAKQEILGIQDQTQHSWVRNASLSPTRQRFPSVFSLLSQCRTGTPASCLHCDQKLLIVLCYLAFLSWSPCPWHCTKVPPEVSPEALSKACLASPPLPQAMLPCPAAQPGGPGEGAVSRATWLPHAGAGGLTRRRSSRPTSPHQRKGQGKYSLLCCFWDVVTHWLPLKNNKTQTQTTQELF